MSVNCHPGRIFVLCDVKCQKSKIPIRREADPPIGGQNDIFSLEPWLVIIGYWILIFDLFVA